MPGQNRAFDRLAQLILPVAHPLTPCRQRQRLDRQRPRGRQTLQNRTECQDRENLQPDFREYVRWIRARVEEAYLQRSNPFRRRPPLPGCPEEWPLILVSANSALFFSL